MIFPSFRKKLQDHCLKRVSGTRKSVHVTYVTTYGLKKNSYAKNVQSEVTLDDLFGK